MCGSPLEILPESIRLETPFVIPAQRESMDVHTPLYENQCEVCGCETETCCKGCKSIFYCSEYHRQQHYEDHGEECLEIQAAKANLSDAEGSFRHQKLCPEYRDLKTILACLENGKAPGLGYKCFCTTYCSDIMMARFNLIAAYLQVKTHRAAVNACNVAIATQFLGRCDPMKIRCITTNLMIRVGSKQNAYDFIKFWLVNGDQYVCTAKKPAPFLNVRNANAFEPCTRLFGAFDNVGMDPPVSFLIPLALIKLKLIADVEELRNCQVLREKLPFDIVYMIKPYLCDTGIVENRPKILGIDAKRGYKKVIKKLEKDMDLIFEIVGRAFGGKYIVWRSFFEKTPKKLDYRYPKEVQKIYNYNADAWMETPGGYEWILKKLAHACYKHVTAENRKYAAAQISSLYNIISSDDRIEPPAIVGEMADPGVQERWLGYLTPPPYKQYTRSVDLTTRAGTDEEDETKPDPYGYEYLYEAYEEQQPEDVFQSLVESFGFGFDSYKHL
ncbi:hypothetical protein TWF718_011112 [Orbilia javanica]|uniref:MYND-type domain-containing protein n=1 Tax=Orbilia javanica TaxID=47235 RepID=A0AAN8MIL6_9PEZI